VIPARLSPEAKSEGWRGGSASASAPYKKPVPVSVAPQPWLRPRNEESLRRIPLASPAGTSCGRETGPYFISRGKLKPNVAAGIACAAEGTESLLSFHPANSPAPQPWLRPRSEESLRRIPSASPASTSCGRETGGTPLNLPGFKFRA
jgi:hypothetical protein